MQPVTEISPGRMVAASLLAAMLAACTVAPKAPPALDLPPLTAPVPERIERWWELFGDPPLTALMEEAMAANLDLRAAAARIEEARAVLRGARTALHPSLDLQAGVNRGRVSEAAARALPPPLVTTTHTLGLQAAYEVDLWGRLGAGRDAAAATVLASRFAAEALKVSLAAEVAGGYFTLRALDEALAITRATLITREENVRLLGRRRAAGLASDLEFAQAEAERAALAAAVPALERAQAQTQAALAALAGRGARRVVEPDVARGSPSPPVPEVPAGLPSDLLARRPDIRRAQAELAAADARSAEAEARFFPQLVLTASYGGESAAFADLLSRPARVWTVAGSLLMPLLGRARIEAEADAVAARREQAAIAYQVAVQAAFRDVHDALAANRAARAIETAQAERRHALEDAMRLAEVRHVNGYSGYLEVLDAQRNLLDARRGEADARRDRLTALVSLWRALGGGWDPAAVEAATP